MEFIEIIKVIIIGIVQGITEWLPVSSTGHMIIVDELLNLNVSDAFLEMFLVVIQFGSILAVLVLYFERLNPFSRKKKPFERRQTYDLWLKVIVGIIPAGVMGLLFNDWFDEHFYNYQTVAIALIVYGVLFIIIEKHNKRRRPSISKLSDLTYKTAFLIGCVQVLALVPGTSRSGSTILGGMLIGTSRYVAAEFSFFLAIPIMFGASALKILDFGLVFTSSEILVLVIGLVTAFIVSILAITLLMSYIKKHDFTAFGYYRIILGIVVLAYFMLG